VSGSVPVWIGNGLAMPWSARTRLTRSGTPRDSKVGSAEVM
jgi:hypothetical protein